MKKILLPLLLVLGTSAYAQGVNASSNIKISAKVISGCQLSGDNANFATVEKNIRTSMDLRVQCSKSTPIVLTASSKVNPGTTYGQFMTIGKKTLATPMLSSPEAIQYFINTTDVVTNTKYTVTKRPRDESLFLNINTSYDYRLGITINTNEQVILPFKAQITIYNDFMRLIPGNYADDATYHVTF